MHSGDGKVSAKARGASIVQIESGKLVPLIIVLALVAGAGIAVSVAALSYAGVAERESRMLQYYVLEMDAKLIAAGVKKPEESVASKLKEKGK